MIIRLVFLFFLSAPVFGYEVIAHRGASVSAPENTMAAIRAAESLHASYVEIDVHLTRDGHVVVIHDRKVNRTTNGSGYVRDLTLEEISKLDAGSWLAPQFSGEKIPTLEEVFQNIHRKTKVIIELKYGLDKYPNIEKKVIQLVKKYKLQDRVIVKSFNPDVLKTFEEIAPLLPRLYVLIASFGNFTIDHTFRMQGMFNVKNVDLYQVHKCFVTKTLVTQVHAKGRKIIAWGVTLNDLRTMVTLGVDSIEVDDPHLFRTAL